MSDNQFKSMLTKVSDTIFPMVQSQLEDNSISMSDYQKQCVMNAISAINNAMDVAGISWNDSQLDQSNITKTLLSVASLQLNASASPNEVYFQIRNVKYQKRENGKLVDDWRKQIEMGIEGDGNDAILSRFGRNVKQIMKHWEVREGDDFQYPRYDGLEMESPKWIPKGKGKVVRVVYPIIKDGDLVEFHISEREDVIKNLIAHISNNLMNETFGIAKNRYQASAEQKKQIKAKKDEILEKANSLGVDGAIDDEEVQRHISPAWKDFQSRESMIIRKMRNNIVKNIPKDFGNTMTEHSYDLTSNENMYRSANKEIEQNANSEILDFEGDAEGDNEKEDVTPSQEEKEQQTPSKDPEKEEGKEESFDNENVPF